MPSSQNQKTAVIYFSLSPDAQVIEKIVASDVSYKANSKIVRLLSGHTCRQIERSGLPYFTYNEENQTGRTFGEKITHAFEAVFSRGYENVIVVGNDTPALKSKHLVRASELLESNRASVVLGPAFDGGTWLMGFQKSAFDSDAFCSLPWNTSNLLSSLVEKYQKEHEITLFERLADIDHQSDLKYFLRHPSTDDSLKLLRKSISTLLVEGNTYNDPLNISSAVSDYTFIFSNRGPPTASEFGRLHY